MTEKEKIQIRLDLKGELAEKFEAIKREKGLENNTDVVRNLITEEYKRIPEPKEA